MSTWSRRRLLRTAGLAGLGLAAAPTALAACGGGETAPSGGGETTPLRVALGWIRNVDDVYLDPLRLVGAGPVRLLPLWRDTPVGSAASPAASPYAGAGTLVDALAGTPYAGIRW